VNGIEPNLRPDTEHGLLVVYGQFARQNGLLDRLMVVPVSARTRLYKPQAKIAEFLVGILSGIEYLQDLDLGPNPLALAAKRLGEASAPPLPSSLLPQALPAPDEGSSARRRLEKRRVTWQGERRRARAELLKAQSVLAGHRRQAAALRQGMDALGRWLGQLEADNATNPGPPVCILRVDAGFASGPNVTWLIESRLATKSRKGSSRSNT